LSRVYPLNNQNVKLHFVGFYTCHRLMEIILSGPDSPIQEVIKTVKPEIQPDKIPRVLEGAYSHQHLLQPQ
jgi:hypothetical protein